MFQNSHLSIEEFHAKLQEATNFPLRPFVIPFLKVSPLVNSAVFQDSIELLLLSASSTYHGHLDGHCAKS